MNAMSRRSRRGFVTACIVVALLAGAAFVWALFGMVPSASGPACQVTIGSEKYSLDREQVTNALAITTVASDLGLPHHAVTIAVAAALQESGLHNLDHGDRDSVGIFLSLIHI